eukprot:CAMPEP_0183346742 /NCGR_PEP_ID=MMETSP0164_2-20130417/11769_1 /TAXON_ID=221442 /ORGANISM="Coccolithus pelagicus ssp braarudi, Strain PLY182g" /LENGTH=40 /DNA_ID= /DNA_START= /DNA_END= /DNA_ORIENTATION=
MAHAKSFQFGNWLAAVEGKDVGRLHVAVHRCAMHEPVGTA